MTDRNGAIPQNDRGLRAVKGFQFSVLPGEMEPWHAPLTKLRSTTSGPPIRGGTRVPQFPDRNFCDR